jgi:hypothetical protein
VIAYQQIHQMDLAADTARQLLSARPEFTVSSWAKTQFRADAARLEADVAALRVAGIPMG